MKEMFYQATRLDPPERIADGEYKGFTYYVLSLGTHPCAYIDVTETDLNGVDYCNIDLECHCDLTYSREYLATVTKKAGLSVGITHIIAILQVIIWIPR